MPDETAKSKASRTKAKGLPTVEAVQEKIRKKLEKAGTKGAAAAYGKVAPLTAEAAILAQALAGLVRDDCPEIFIDRRGQKPKYYLWSHRPKLPTADRVAEKILTFAREQHPHVFHELGFARNAGLLKEEKALVADALRILGERAQLATLEFAPTPKSKHRLYVVTGTSVAPGEVRGRAEFAGSAPSAPPLPLNEAAVKAAYDTLARQSGFPAVPIAALQKAAVVPMDDLKDFLRREHQAGGVALSVGDWSIADEEERQGVIEWLGRRYLQVRWL